MSTIVTRSGKGSPLTHAEVDSNFTNLNTDKLELSGGTMTGDVGHGDNVKATFGASADLQVYHDGSNSVIDDVGSGVLYMRSNGDGIGMYDSENDVMLFARKDAEVALYHNGSSKLATTSTGIDVTGTVVADAATLSGTAPILRYTDTDNTITAQIGSGTSDFNIATTTSHNIDIRTNNTRRMVVESDGDISFYEDTGTTAKFFWDASTERLGIGTTSPNRALSVDSSQQIVGTFGSTNTKASVSFVGSGTTDDDEVQVGADGNDMFLRTGNNERMRIKSGGNVGIGTSSPSEKLEVNGTAKATTFEVNGWTITESGGSLYFATGGTNKMKLDASGNLDVVGSVNSNATIS